MIDATITQLRAYCPPLAGNVAGAADFRLGLQNYNATLPLPAGYVVPLDQDSDGNQIQRAPGLQQEVIKRIGVIVEFDASPDRRGQAPTSEYDDIEIAIFAALLNWKPDQGCHLIQGYWFHGGRFLDLDRARLFYQWEFALYWQITDLDGWQEPVDPAPASIQVNLYDKQGALPVEDPPDVPFAVIPIPGPDDPDDAETMTPQLEDA